MTPQPTPCMEWQMAKNPQGYGVKKYDRKLWLAHRLAWDTVNGPIPDGMFVLHKCDNPACVNVDHLFLGTHTDNMRDMTAKNRQPNGERHYEAKLTERQVKYIRELYARGGITHAEIGAAYGVTEANICDIINRRTWKHI